jgi:cysteine desulfurase
VTHSPSRLYLDHAATTPLLPEVRAAMQPWLENEYGNPSSLHAEGRRAKEELDRSRESISDILGCSFGEVTFTSGGTEAANLALIGAALASGRKRVLLSAADHHCVLSTQPILERLGCTVELLPVDRFGNVPLAHLEATLGNDVSVVAAMHANNELGTLHSVSAIGEAAHRAGALFFCDAVQTFGSEVNWRVDDLQADLVGISAHKINGPKGVGALFVRAGTEITPMIYGGGQERELRAGTENVPGIAGFSAAAGLHATHRGEYASRKDAAASAFRRTLQSLTPEGLAFTLPEEIPHLCGHVHLRFEGIMAESMLIGIDRQGISASSGAACSSGSIEPSHVLLACGYSDQEAKEGLRFSFGVTSTVEEAERAAQIVAGWAQKVREVRAVKRSELG